MSVNLQSSRIETLFESALRDYEKQTGIPLAKHPLTEQLQNCQSVDSVTTLLHDQARAFSDFRGSDKIMKSLKSVVSALSKVSAIAAVVLDTGMVCPWLLYRSGTPPSTSLTPIRQSYSPADAVYTSLAVLLAVCASFVSTCVISSHPSISDVQGRQFRLRCSCGYVRVHRALSETSRHLYQGLSYARYD